MSSLPITPPVLPASGLTPVEAAKRLAARRAVDEYVVSGQVVGVGSGSTIVYAIDRLAERKNHDGLDVICIPTSFQSQQLILQNGLKLGDLSQNPEIDVTIDGADEVDSDLNCIKGGGGCQTQEKIVAFNAKTFVIVADFNKQSQRLGQNWRKGVPIEVIPMAYVPLQRRFRAMGGNAVLRMAKAKAGPVVTDNGNFILDVDFGEISSPAQLQSQLCDLPGVVETGLFVGMASKAFFGQADGSVVDWVETQSNGSGGTAAEASS